METIKHNLSSWKILIIFFATLFIVAAQTNRTFGVSADEWIIPIIMAVFGFIGAVIGGVLGGIVGLIGLIFRENTFVPGLKYGAAIGFMGLLILWYVGCWMNGSSVCIAQ